MKLKMWLVMAVVCATQAGVRAEVQPHALFTDGCVLQRGVATPVWGKAQTGEKVTVEFRGQTASAVADLNGHWKVVLPPTAAGGPFTLVIRGANTITLTNVLVGEVWVCSGQSNMGFTLNRADNAATVIPASADAQLRLFKVPMVTADLPQYSVNAAWAVCGPNTVSNFTAVGYFFGRDLRQHLKIPVGLIMTAWGGSYAEAWTDHATLEKVLPAAFDRYAASIKSYDPEKAKAQFEKAKANHKAAVARAKAAGKPVPNAPRQGEDPRTTKNRPSVLFNAMLAPLQPFAIRGAIWYQGESNAGHAKEYQTLFPAMIADWRQTWGLGDFPFLFVQIAPFQGQPPEIREAQLISWQKTPNTAMAVITDHGEAADIHPKAKEPVGQRLALAARALAYGEPVEYSGPVFQKMKIRGDRAVLSFEHLGGGLVVPPGGNGALKGFTIAGADKKFVPADAVLEGDTVVVRSAQVPAPTAVRFGWANVPDINLFNKAGLPATPFRTDVE